MSIADGAVALESEDMLAELERRGVLTRSWGLLSKEGVFYGPPEEETARRYARDSAPGTTAAFYYSSDPQRVRS